MNKNKWPIAKITFAALICLQVITVGLMMLISHLWGEDAYLKHVNGLMKAVATESVQSVESLLQPAEYSIKRSRQLMESGVLPATSGENLERYLFEEVKVNPNFSGMYFAWVNGEFLFVTRNEVSSKNPYMSKYVLDDGAGKRSAETIYRTEAFVEQFRTTSEADYDPRVRPWYKAITIDEHCWTSPYIFYTSQRPGITASTVVRDQEGNAIGVLGLDIHISNLSYFLSKNELSPNSSAVIVTSDKRTVAHTDFDEIMRPDLSSPSNYHLINVEDMEDELINKSIQALEASGMTLASEGVRTVKLEYKGEPYYAVFHSYSKLGIEWTVIVTAPESDFIEAIRNAQFWQILTVVICSLMITLIAFLMAVRFLKPVSELQETVLRNSLTGLYNRRALDRFGNTIIEEAHAEGRHVSVAMIDLDRFKSINDTYGHPVGDEVLIAVSQRMLNVLKKSDVLARYGGEEFAVIMVGADLITAKTICERLRVAVNRTPVMTKAGGISVTVSVGLEEIAAEDDSFYDALSAADQALYMAKSNGRDQVCVFPRTPKNKLSFVS